MTSCLVALRKDAMTGNDAFTAEERRRPPCDTGCVDCCLPVSSNLTLQTMDAACRNVLFNGVSSECSR